MISLILPYWMRQKAADDALLAIERLYPDLDLEVIVVDDGSEIPFVNPCTKLNVRVITLPMKKEPKSPIVPWNVGVREAKGEIIVLSCVEILHEKPVLEELAREVKALGPKGYVLAAAWCPEFETWHCHSTVQPPFNPPGTGIGFCGAMHKSLFIEAGGFDEEYRDSGGYEDCDFINRLLSVGAQFVHRDDLVVIHPKTDADIKWDASKFSRNFELFKSKWPNSPNVQTMNFVCVQANNYQGRGAQYVNTLFDMVRRNMPLMPYRFWCLTDDPEGLHPQISIVRLPDDVHGWWGKLYLFKKGLFPQGERMIFFDLDTLIIGSLVPLLGYKGEMAILRDFYQPRRGAPGVILWESGTHTDIWDEWESQGRPENPMGDLGWIENLDQGRYTKRLGRLQDLFPKMFVSYKADCRPYPPEGAAVVCFHGEPRPHNCAQPWVELIWKVGGGSRPELEQMINTNRDRLWANLESSSKLALTNLQLQPECEGEVLLVGGGPSVKKYLGEIMGRQAEGALVVALNGSADFLYENGITPDWHLMVDARPENVRFVRDSKAKRFFIGSICDPLVFQALEGRDVTIFHPHISDMENRAPDGAHLIGGGSTIGLLAMSIAYTQGFRKFHLYGYDSSYEDDHHAYKQPENDGEVTVEAVVNGRKFKCAAWMVTQVQEFQQIAPVLANYGCEIYTHGSGLLPHVAWLMEHQLPEAA